MNPSPAETAAHIGEVRNDFHKNVQTAADLAEFLKGIGMTEAEFFASDFARERYGQVLAIGRLRAAVLRGIDRGAATTTWEQFQKATRGAAQVEIVDPSLR
jgi:hypothetical protein